MKKIYNLNIMSSVNALVLSGITLVGFSACGKDNSIEEQNNTISSTSVSDGTDITTSYTTLNDYVNTGVDVTGYNETTNSGEYIVTDVIDNRTTSVYETTAIANDTFDEDVNITKNIINTTIGTNTSKSTNLTTKTTNSTTKTITKATTTTTKVTKPPVVRYSIDDICYNVDAFEFYAEKLRRDLIQGNTGINMIYGSTNFYDESRYILALINEGCINNNVLSAVFSKCSSACFEKGKTLVNCMGSLYDVTRFNIDFTQYGCSSKFDVVSYINSIERSYIDGSIQSYVKNQVVDGNLNSKYLENTAVMSFFCGYDIVNPQFSHIDVEEMYIEPFIDQIYHIVFGHGYYM